MITDLLHNRHDPLLQEIAALRRQLDDKDAIIHDLRVLLMAPADFPLAWHLTPSENRVLARLAKTPGVVTKLALHAAIGECTDPQTIQNDLAVRICRIRHKVPKEVEIETIFAVGYRLTPPSREYLKQFAH